MENSEKQKTNRKALYITLASLFTTGVLGGILAFFIFKKKKPDPLSLAYILAGEVDAEKKVKEDRKFLTKNNIKSDVAKYRISKD